MSIGLVNLRVDATAVDEAGERVEVGKEHNRMGQLCYGPIVIAPRQPLETGHNTHFLESWDHGSSGQMLQYVIVYMVS